MEFNKKDMAVLRKLARWTAGTDMLGRYNIGAILVEPVGRNRAIAAATDGKRLVVYWFDAKVAKPTLLDRKTFLPRDLDPSVFPDWAKFVTPPDPEMVTPSYRFTVPKAAREWLRECVREQRKNKDKLQAVLVGDGKMSTDTGGGEVLVYGSKPWKPNARLMQIRFLLDAISLFNGDVEFVQVAKDRPCFASSSSIRIAVMPMRG